MDDDQQQHLIDTARVSAWGGQYERITEIQIDALLAEIRDLQDALDNAARRTETI